MSKDEYYQLNYNSCRQLKRRIIMYLGLLTYEEKNLFLELAATIAAADGNFSTDEKAMVQAYCNEMQIHYERAGQNKPVDEIIARLKEICSEQTQKIILYEAIGLVMVDGKEDPAETAIIQNIQKSFNISDDFIKQCKTFLQEYISLQEKMNTLILK